MAREFFAYVWPPRSRRAKGGELMFELSLEGRVAVITGGAGLLGRHYAKSLCSAGANVVVADIDEAGATAVVDALHDPGAMATRVDIADQESVRHMVNQVVARFGRIDALINNAAIDPKFDRPNEGAHIESFENYSLHAWQRSLDVNLTGAFLCTQAAAPFLLASGRGSVVNIASMYGLV